MLHSIPEANPAAGGTAPTEGAFSATAPAAAVAGARKSSVSAYLAGQQDLLTTITDGMPYASGMPGMFGAGSSNSTAAASMRCSTASYCSGGSSSSILSAQSTGDAASSSPPAANSRHTAVKEAFSARISSTGEQFLAQPEPWQGPGACTTCLRAAALSALLTCGPHLSAAGLMLKPVAVRLNCLNRPCLQQQGLSCLCNWQGSCLSGKPFVS